MNRLLIASGAAAALALAAGSAYADSSFGSVTGDLGYSMGDGFTADLGLEYHSLTPIWGFSVDVNTSLGLTTPIPLSGDYTVHAFRRFGDSAAGVYAGFSGTNDPSHEVFVGAEAYFALGMIGLTTSAEYEWNTPGPNAIKLASSIEATVRDGLDLEFDAGWTAFADSTRDYTLGASASFAVGDHLTIEPSLSFERYPDTTHDFTVSLDAEYTIGDTPLTLSGGVDYDVTSHTVSGHAGIGFSIDFGGGDEDESPL